MNRKPKNLIFDRNVNLAQGKIIMDKKAEQRNLDQCKAKVDQILAQHNAVLLPVIQILGPQMTTNVIYATRQPPPPNKDVN